LKNSFRPEESDHFLQQVQDFETLMPAGLEAIRLKETGQEYNEEQYQTFLTYLNRFDSLSTQALPLIIPPENPNLSKDEWMTMGAALFSAIRTGSVPPAVKEYAAMSEAYRQNQPDRFNQTVEAYASRLAGMFPEANQKGHLEFFFNEYSPFYKSTILYVLALLLGCVYWLNLSEGCRRTALYLTVFALIIHSSGLLFRMILEGRPPVTNLYSSAIFIGWGAVVLGVILERWYKNSIGVVMACMIGFITLRIAKALSLDGDTMQMLQAVLDTNAWLATHVVIITLGYAATFVAGFLGLLYILLGAFTPALTRDAGKSIVRMVYGTVCFATLLSFVGTILGGIWADQSWGRFWGWDPKENGALLIVIWNALILHARWGGMIRERGLMVMVVFGNVVTAFSWFGVNLLEIGLHSYGFMDGSFWWLAAFAVSQLIIMSVGCFFPQKYWRLNSAPRASS
jgi:ABC-type transport system involved in cytochrome c biogenesis permease subunit